MRVLHLGCAHRHNDNRILLRECKSLQKSGYSVIYATSSEWLDKNQDKSDHVVDGVTVKFGNWKLGGVFVTRDIKSYIKNRIDNKIELVEFVIGENPDILHVHELELMYVVPVIRKKIPDIKVVFDVHEDYPGSYYDLFSVYSNRLFATIASVYVGHALRNYLKISDVVVTVTPYIKQQLEKLRAKDVVLVRNFPIITEKNGYKTDKSWVCYCGTIDEGRNIRTMLECADRFEGQLHLAGQCGGGCERIIDEYKKRLPDKIFYHGVLSHEEVLKLCSSSSVGLCILKGLKNYTTSYATKIFEYMMQGIPVVCSDFPTWRNVVADNECGFLVDPEDKDSIIESVNTILKNNDLAIKMGQNGRKAIEEKYNWDTEAEQLLETYSFLAEERVVEKHVQEG